MTISLAKKINGITIATVVHDGRLAFGSYPAINNTQLAQMSEANYLARLAAFKLYVQNIESGLVVDDCIIAGAEPCRQNTAACPIGGTNNE